MCGLAGERQSVPAGFFGFVSMLRAAHGLRTAFPAFSSAMIFVRLRVWVHAGSDITPKIARCEYGLLSPAAARLFGLKPLRPGTSIAGIWPLHDLVQVHY